MDRTLDALERKLSPSQLLDRSLAYLREHGGDMAVAFGDSVRRNPVPIMLAVAGVGWLVVSSVRTREPIDVTPIDDTPIDDTLETESLYAEPDFPGAGSATAWPPHAPGRVARNIEPYPLSKSTRSCSAASQSRSARCSAP